MAFSFNLIYRVTSVFHISSGDDNRELDTSERGERGTKPVLKEKEPVYRHGHSRVPCGGKYNLMVKSGISQPRVQKDCEIDLISNEISSAM